MERFSKLYNELFNLVWFVLFFPIQILERERERERETPAANQSCQICSRVNSWIVQLLIVRYLLLLYLIGNNKLSELKMECC